MGTISGWVIAGVLVCGFVTLTIAWMFVRDAIYEHLKDLNAIRRTLVEIADNLADIKKQNSAVSALANHGDTPFLRQGVAATFSDKEGTK